MNYRPKLFEEFMNNIYFYEITIQEIHIWKELYYF